MEREAELVLVGRLRDGDAAAFDAVYEAYRARLYSFLSRLSRSRDVAEDLAEETWLRLVSTASRLRPDTRLGPWLFAVARNLYYSYCRSRALDESAADGLIGLWPAGGPRPSPFEEAAARELERRVERGLGALSAPYREALLLVGVEGMTPSEAAGVCGLAPEAFRQRLSRARAALDRELGALQPGPATLAQREEGLGRTAHGPASPKLREDGCGRTAAEAEEVAP
jgi:RNA polymerase sigma-70 factor (ECF subfamily)